MTEPTIWQLLSFHGGWGTALAHGVMLTLIISVCSYVVSVLLGCIFVMAKQSHFVILRQSAGLYTGIVRGLPELLIVLLLYYSLSSGVETVLIRCKWVGADFSISPFFAAVVALGFVSGAYMTEVMRAAFLAVPKGEIEAAYAFGMTKSQVLRRIILPHVIRFAIPGMGNLWLAITKESAIISVLGNYHELLYSGYMAAAGTQRYVLFYSVTALLFLAITLVSMWGVLKLEARFSRGHK